MSDKNRKGIDVSVHQGKIDFVKVAKDGVTFMIPRCGYARTDDKEFFRNVEEASTNGIDIPGVYLFSYALDVSDAKKEAWFAIEQVRKARLPKSTVIFFDLEYDTIRYAKSKGVSIGKHECIDHTRAFCKEVEEQGYTAGVYYNLDYYRNMYEPEVVEPFVRWLADWTGEADLECEYHQYTSKGRVRGIKGFVDLNYTELPTDDGDGSITFTEIEIVDEILKGNLGNGDERKYRVEELGFNYDHIQTLVNDYINIVNEVIEGKWYNGEERKLLFEESPYNYQIIQDHVNRLLE